MLHRLGHHEEAAALLREAVAIRRETLGATNWRTGYVRMELGTCLTAQGRFEEAEALPKESVAVLSAERGAEHRMTQQARQALGDLYKAWGKPAPVDT